MKEDITAVLFTAGVAALTAVILHKYWRTRQWLNSDAGVFLAPVESPAAIPVAAAPAGDAPLAVIVGE